MDQHPAHQGFISEIERGRVFKSLEAVGKDVTSASYSLVFELLLACRSGTTIPMPSYKKLRNWDLESPDRAAMAWAKANGID